MLKYIFIALLFGHSSLTLCTLNHKSRTLRKNSNQLRAKRKPTLVTEMFGLVGNRAEDRQNIASELQSPPRHTR